MKALIMNKKPDLLFRFDVITLTKNEYLLGFLYLKV